MGNTVVAVGYCSFLIFTKLSIDYLLQLSLSEYQKRVVIRVEGMTCKTCAQSIRSAPSKVQGVMAINVDLEKGEVAVGFDSGMEDIPVTPLF